MTPEYIAEKSRTPLYSSIFCIVLCVALGVFSIFEMATGSNYFPFYLFAAIICVIGLIIFTITLIKWLRVPEHIITKVGEKLYFDAADFTADEIEYVNYRRARFGRYSFVVLNYGSITVALTDGRQISCNFVADVEQVNGILFTLAKIMEYDAKSAAQ